MNVLELIETLDTGGAERMVSCLALSMRAQGDSVSIVCLRDLGRMPIPREHFDEAGVNLVELNKTDGFSPKAVRQLLDYVRDQNFDVIHTHNPQVNHYGALVARLGSIPVLVNTLHGTSTLGMPRWALALYRVSCAGTTRVVPVCKAVDVELRQRLGLSPYKTAVIYNGIDLSELQTLPVRAPDGEFVFGTMGRLVPVKDHRSLLEAFHIVKQRHAHCRLEILGFGELEDDLKNLAETLGISGSVVFRGFSSDVGSFLRGIDAFVLSSVSEGLPLTLLEGMAAGKPIVSTAVGGVPELVQDAECGWLSEPSQPQRLAEIMMQAVESPDLEEKGRRGRRQAIARYSVEAMTAQYRALFGELLGSRTPKSVRTETAVQQSRN